LDALTDGVELHVDLGWINGRPFVNNASFGAYAGLVRRPEYRDDKTHTALQALPDLLVGGPARPSMNSPARSRPPDEGPTTVHCGLGPYR
jgi:hypothetical protein